jgi:capsid protein
MARSGYDAISSTGKRKAASPIIKREDELLLNRDRNAMIGSGQSLYRNFSMVAWAVRKHLDYNTHFGFQARTENEEFNEQLETLMWEWERPANCDSSGRMPFSSMMRLAEARRVVDGDFFFMKRLDGTLSAVEADLIRDPDDLGTEGDRWFNGGKVNADGRVLAWGLHKRLRNGQYEFLRTVPSGNLVHLCNFDRFDQVRGISPLASAFNSFRDVYEGIDYALAKLKVEQLFAFVVKSANASGTGEYTRNGDGTYDVDFGRGPVKLELDNDDTAEFLKSDNPGSNTQDFINLVLSMAIKALDLPINFVDESKTNFFGSRAAWMLYDRSCVSKRAIILEALRKITIWKMAQWIQSGELVMPAGMLITDVDFEWVHMGMPWWDPAKEINGDLAAMQAGLDNPYRICKERGRGEFEENVLLLAKAKKFAEANGVSLSFLAAPTEPGTTPPPADPEEDVEEDDQENAPDEVSDES